MHHGCRRAFFKGSYGALHFRGHEPRNETRLVYKDLNTLALQLPKRKLALSKATQDQRLVWEVLRLLDKAQRSERDADVARALRELREKALGEFTASPHDGKRIFEEIASTVTKQVAVRATQQAIRSGDGATGGGGGGAGNAHATNARDNGGRGDGGASGGLVRKMCFRKAFDGKCELEKCDRLH